MKSAAALRLTKLFSSSPIVLALVILAATNVALAQSLSWTGTRSVLMDGVSKRDNAYSYNDNLAHKYDSYKYSGDNYAHTGIDGQSDYGILRAYAYSTASNANLSGGGVQVSDAVRASWSDMLTLSGQSGPVSLRFTMSLDVDYSSTQRNGGQSAFTYADTAVNVGGDLTPLHSEYIPGSPGGLMTDHKTATFTRTFAVGAEVPIDQFLYVRSDVSAPEPGDYAKRKVDAMNTAQLGIEVLTPGGGFTSTSGAQSVMAPIPEPAICAMMAGGFALLGFAARRRRQSA